jgi:ABC-2 type transport system permease protein
VYALSIVDVEWTLDKQVVLASAVVSGMVIYFCIFVLGGAFCFWTTQGKEATHIFTYGGDALASFPLDIYVPSIQRFFTFVVPLAFVNYEPVLYVLGRPDPLGLPDPVRLLSPVAAVLMVLLACLGWWHGVRHYQSAGS